MRMDRRGRCWGMERGMRDAELVELDNARGEFHCKRSGKQLEPSRGSWGRTGKRVRVRISSSRHWISSSSEEAPSSGESRLSSCSSKSMGECSSHGASSSRESRPDCSPFGVLGLEKRRVYCIISMAIPGNRCLRLSEMTLELWREEPAQASRSESGTSPSVAIRRIGKSSRH
jgi:hypothetical protein